MNLSYIRGWFDKYLASPPDGASIAREIYYRIVHSHRWLWSKFQPNRTRSFVLTACGSVSADFRKMEKEQYRLVIPFLFLERKLCREIKERLDAVYGDSYPLMATTSKIGLTSFNIAVHRFLMSHGQVPQKWLPRRIT